MGCQISKNEDDTREKAAMESTVATASNPSNTDVNYKSRLEWKICIVCGFVVANFIEN